MLFYGAPLSHICRRLFSHTTPYTSSHLCNSPHVLYALQQQRIYRIDLTTAVPSPLCFAQAYTGSFDVYKPSQLGFLDHTAQIWRGSLSDRGSSLKVKPWQKTTPTLRVSDCHRSRPPLVCCPIESTLCYPNDGLRTLVDFPQ